jgi:hypothetical protein
MGRGGEMATNSDANYQLPITNYPLPITPYPQLANRVKYLFRSIRESYNQKADPENPLQLSPQLLLEP